MTSPKIVINNAVWSQVQGLNYLEIEELCDHLRVRDKYSPFGFKRAKNTETPGWVRFMDEEGNFLTGLIPNVQEALVRVGHGEGDVFKKKTCPDLIPFREELLTPTLVMPRGQPLRENQMEFLHRFLEFRRGIIHAATGFGKTAVMAAILKMLPPRTVALVIINSLDLIDQTFKEFVNFGVPEDQLGIFTGNNKKANYITITTSSSLPNLIEMLPSVRLLIADEAHEKIVSAATVPYLREMVCATDRVCLSATPWRKKDPPHNWKLRGHFGVVLGVAKTQPLQEAGILSRANTYFHLWGENNEESEDFELPYDEAYNKLIIDNDAWHDKVAAMVASMKGRTLIRVERKTHGMNLLARIPNAIWISGDDKKAFRNEVREKLKTSPEDTPVIATKIFNTGVDIYLHNLVNCAGMESDIATIQGYGRGLRLAPDKDHVDYHDFYHTTNRHLLRHSKARARTLKKEGHKVELLDDLR